MDIVQIWNDAVRNIVDSKENIQEKTIIQLFCAQVMLSIDNSKIHFFCNSMYIYNLFLPYVGSFYEEIKRITGRNDFGISIEIGSATMPGVTQPPHPGMPMQNVDVSSKTTNEFVATNQDYEDNSHSVFEEESQLVDVKPITPKKRTNSRAKVQVKQDSTLPIKEEILPEDEIKPFAVDDSDSEQLYSKDEYSIDDFQIIDELVMPTPTSRVRTNKKKVSRTKKQTNWSDNYEQGSESIFIDNTINSNFGSNLDSSMHIPVQGQNQAYNQYAQNILLNNGALVTPNRNNRNKIADLANSIHSKFLKNDIINPLKTFDNYVIDPENKILYATAMAVAENPGTTSYNPLYMYGGSGLGKTHLLFAIANQILKNNPNVKLLYTRAEKFIQHYVESMTTKQMHFQDVYTSYDVFIVDDIQSFIKAEKTRDAFFDIIAEFIDKPSKQLILASDVSPSKLKGFSQRLTTRFGSGVCCEVIPPSSETRMAIILKKCQELNIQFSQEVIQYIANNIRTNVREIEGAIKTLNSRKDVFHGEITLEQAELALNSIVNNTNTECSIDYIKQKISAEFGVSISDMESASRKKAVSLARSMSMSLIRELLPTTSLADIGRAFNKDHSSVHEAINRINKKMNQDHELALNYKRLASILKKD